MSTLKRVWILGLCSCVLATSVGSAHETAFNQSLDQLIEGAEAGLEKGDPELAESSYRTAFVETWMQLALLAAADGDLAGTESALREATVAAATSERRTRSSLALVLLWRDKIDESLVILRDLVAKHPKNNQLGQLLAQALVAADRGDEARQQIEVMRPRLPGLSAALEARMAEIAAAEEETGEVLDWPARREAFLPPVIGGGFEEVSAAERATERERLVATQKRVLHNLAVLRKASGHPPLAANLLAAMEAVSAKVRDDSPSPYGHVDLTEKQLDAIRPLRVDATALWATATVDHLAVLELLRDGKLEEAETELRRRLVQRDDPVERDMLGVLLAHRGEEAKAREHFAAVVESIPDFQPARQHLARLLLRDGSHEAAVVQLRAAAELGDLTELDLALELAAVETATGKVDTAYQRLRAAADRFGSPTAYLRMSKIDADRGKVQESLGSVTRAMRFAPNSEAVLAAMVRRALAADRLTQAVGASGALVRLYPQVGEYHLLEARTKLAEGDLVAARRGLEKALELDPGLSEAQRYLRQVCEQLGDPSCSSD